LRIRGFKLIVGQIGEYQGNIPRLFTLKKSFEGTIAPYSNLTGTSHARRAGMKAGRMKDEISTRLKA
jgi:hypothetical protein